MTLKRIQEKTTSLFMFLLQRRYISIIFVRVDRWEGRHLHVLMFVS